MEIFVKFDNKTNILFVNNEDNINRIFELLKIHHNKNLIYLCSKCKILEPNKSFSYYNFNKYDCIDITYKLKGGRELPPALKESQQLKEKIIKEIGVDRKYWFGLNTYFYGLRTEALKDVKDSKDFKSIHKKVLELFDRDMKSKGKEELSNYVIKLADEIKKKRSKK
jgi:hypothetical protein